MPINAQVLLSILSHESTSGDISQTLRVTPATYSLSLGDGTGANQAQVAWSGVIATPATVNLKSLTDDRGTVSLSAIKTILVVNDGPDDLRWNGGSWAAGPLGTPSGSSYGVPAGGAWIATAPSATGWAVGGAPQTMLFDSTGTATFSIILIGEGTIT